MGLRKNDAQPLHKKYNELNVQGIKGLYQSLSHGSFLLVGSARLTLYGWPAMLIVALPWLIQVLNGTRLRGMVVWINPYAVPANHN